MYISYILFFLFSFLHLNIEKKHTIFVAKIDWHVGIIIQVNESAKEKIDALREFGNFKYVDIGWGDAEFYQSSEDFDLYLASKAILFPTNSVLRIRGYDYEIDKIIGWRDFVFELQLTDIQFQLLCNFINNSFSRNPDNNLLIESEQLNGIVKFYTSIHKYHLLNTCNTWVAEALETAETEIETSNVVTAEELFNELVKFAHLINIEQKR